MPDPQPVFQPNTQAELAQFVGENASNLHRRLRPIGGGTASPGNEADSVVEVHLDKLNRVIDFPARDMTITVEAGTRMAELARILKAENQRLPIDVPQAEQATLGGVIATNWSGSRRFGCGTMRDYVIGISAIDASGREFKAGGQVVKNVAGYDLCKLLVGSRGTLAIITQVTLKLRPVLETSALVRLTFDSLSQIDAVLNRLLSSATRPMVLDVLSGTGKSAHSTTLVVGYEGAVREVAWQVETLLKECRPFEPRATESYIGADAEDLWNTLRDFSIETSSDATFKASLPPSRTCELLRLANEAGFATQAHAGNGIVIGHLPNRVKTGVHAAVLLTPLSEFVRSNGGALSMLRAPSDWPRFNVAAESLAGTLAWGQRLKRQLDPHNLLNPVV